MSNEHIIAHITITHATSFGQNLFQYLDENNKAYGSVVWWDCWVSINGY